MMWPEALTAAVAAALVAGYWAGSAQVIERAVEALDQWAWKHAARRTETGRRPGRWWLGQGWFAARIAGDFVVAPRACLRHLREVREDRRRYRARQQQGAQQ
ncbi:hypothetical protein ACIOEZ_32785 [Streptomyces sp. NPDC087866]|uniref:hypothetical protein n=1 Tax=Streptomyces sp. NPDC087866 TaxID=3365815 RepID=UPI003825AA8F